METRKMRLLSFVLAVAMMFAVMPVSAFATDSGATTDYEITVTSADTGDNTKSAVQKALERAYPNVNLGNVENLTVKTANDVALNKNDFAFMSGTKVTKPAEDRYAPAEVQPEGFVYLSGLLTLDLSGATCENNMIPGRAFYNDTVHTSKITKIILPNNLERIGLAAFCNMTNLSYLSTSATENLRFDGVKILGESMVSGDAALKGTLALPDSLEGIGASCFANSGIEGNIVIKGSLNIKDNADYAPSYKYPNCEYLFYNTNIASIRFESGIETIPAHIAANVSNLQSIVIPNTVKNIGSEAFFYSAQKEQKTVSFQKDLVIPESVESIEYAAFYNVGNVQNIIVENPNVLLNDACFAHLTTKIYFKSAQTRKDANNYDCWSNTATILNTDGGDVTPNSTETYENTGLYIPVKDGYKFAGWCDANGNKLTTAAETGKTYTAKWTPYKTTVEPKVEANADPASKTVEITVNVNADPTELDGATATLNFTDANGNDDSANVVEVKVNGTPFNKDENDKYTAKLNDLMKTTHDASENGTDAVMLADVNEDAVVPSTMMKGTARLTVTYKNPGKHRVAIVLKAANGDVIREAIATVEIAPEPGTLNLTGCTAKLEDGTPVENGAKVPVGAEVTVTFEQDADSDLVLNGWKVTPETLTDTNDKLVKDITADTFTFKMPETDKGVTIEALTKAKAAAPAADDSLDAAAVVTGVVLGTGTAILAYHIGTEVYAEQVLGKGVAIPRTREEVALKAWELAGKPAVELNGEPLSEAAQAEKWAVESGLMQNVDGSFNGSKKMSKLKALRTLDAAKKLG